MTHPFHGLITALITPFKDDAIDIASLEKLLDHQKKGGVKAVVVAGSTGEAPTLSNSEYSTLIENALKCGINIIAGCGSSSTRLAIDMALTAEKLGVSGIMATIPGYNKPTQEGLYRHFKAIHDATNLPIMLYTVPSRTGADFTDETIYRLGSLPRIVAMKDAGSDIERPLRISTMLPDFAILAGDDANTLAFYAQGGSGIVSVASNIAPSEINKMCRSWETNHMQDALALQRTLLPLYKAMFVETNPVPVKYAASLLGLCYPEVRLPLCELSASNKNKVLDAMRDRL
jgi:4-hydroxy-tetrahydrodipicolinate synthase